MIDLSKATRLFFLGTLGVWAISGCIQQQQKQELQYDEVVAEDDGFLDATLDDSASGSSPSQQLEPIDSQSDGDNGADYEYDDPNSPAPDLEGAYNIPNDEFSAENGSLPPPPPPRSSEPAKTLSGSVPPPTDIPDAEAGSVDEYDGIYSDNIAEVYKPASNYSNGGTPVEPASVLTAPSPAGDQSQGTPVQSIMDPKGDEVPPGQMISDNQRKSMSPPPRWFEPPEVMPSFESLYWIGFDYQKPQRRVVVTIKTTGRPPYELFKQQNQAEQAELVLRLIGVERRRKISRDVDASEFSSPLAYIRTRSDQALGSVDVVFTLRESVRPTLAVSKGEWQFHFPIPDHYFELQTTDSLGSVEVDERGQLLSDNLLPIYVEGSELPIRLDGEVFNPELIETIVEPVDDPVQVQVESYAQPDRLSQVDASGLPADFENAVPASQESSEGQQKDNAIQIKEKESSGQESPQNGAELENAGPVNHWVLDRRFHLMAVGQDDGYDEDFSDLQDIASDFTDQGDFNVYDENIQGGSGQEYQPSNQPAVNSGNYSSGYQDPSLFTDSQYSGGEDGGGDTYGYDSPGIPESFTGRLMTLEFHETPLSLVLKTFSEESGNNFTFPSTVGNLAITIILRQVPWDEALQAILETNGLAMVMVGDKIARIDLVENITSYLRKLENADLYKRRLEPTKILVVRLNNAKAESASQQLAKLLANDAKQDNRVQVTADARTNSVVVEAPEHVLAKVKDLIDRLDTRTPQVEIAARIVQVEKDNSDFFGIVWANSLNFDPGRGLGFGSLNFPNSLNSNFTVDPGVSGRGTAGQGVFRFGSINKFFDLDLLLKMEERRGTTNVLQSNNILVLDRIEANIISGESQFFRPAASGTVINPGEGGGGSGEGSGLAEVTFNLELKVTPEVTASGIINMDVHITSDLPGPTIGEQLASKETRELNTRMAKRSGETAVIGGIYNTRRVETQLGVPYLSAIPILGALFRSTQMEEAQSELLIMITPRIVDANGDEAGDGNENSPSLADADYNLPTDQTDLSVNNTLQASQGEEVDAYNSEASSEQVNYGQQDY